MTSKYAGLKIELKYNVSGIYK